MASEPSVAPSPGLLEIEPSGPAAPPEGAGGEEKKVPENGDSEEEGSEGEDQFEMEPVAEVKAKDKGQHLFVMGNKARTGGRDTQFYQVSWSG